MLLRIAFAKESRGLSFLTRTLSRWAAEIGEIGDLGGDLKI